ncbi:pulmonary surfactant-associated protein B [Heteronotia binoei]|uniref:pulmonary surfactant-associated protein B n=1 Tax=Heteronotia binoei TaxID=13085 RepID=UPI00292F5E78|nr:pulmonary surfactant-associated protein B [Heteronotia binoei]
MLQLLLLTFLFGGSALANKISIHHQCAKGPTYSCKNLMTAIQCGTLQHCILAGWNPTINDSCTDCEQIVNILIRMAKESSFKEIIRKYLDRECTTLPLQTLVPRCQTLVDTYLDLFISSLEGQIKPLSVCTKLGLCHSEPLESKNTFDMLVPVVEQFFQLLQGKALITPNSQTEENPEEELPIPLPLCWLCRSFVGRVESLIPKAAIAKVLSQLCRILPLAVAGMCECLMEKYTMIIVDLILGKLGPRLICGMMLMCATEENCGPEINTGPLPCQACLTVTSQVKLSIKANSTQIEIEAAFLSTCSSIYPEWQEECKSFVHQDQSKLAILLAKPWSSKRTCQELGACVAEEGEFPGDKACAQGPTYWCSNLSAAEECKAVQHCQAHVWL